LRSGGEAVGKRRYRVWGEGYRKNIIKIIEK
jgi:hypothetical protein